MKTIALVTALLLAATTLAEDQTARDSVSLVKLRDEIRETLPAGWRVEVTPDVPVDLIEQARDRYDRCCLMIWYEDKVLGRWEGLNQGPIVDEEELELRYDAVVPTLRLTVAKYLSPQQYEQAADENIRRQRLRLASEPRGPTFHMGSRPVPPSGYRPQTPEEREALRRYSLLWTQTELQPLPRYYYEKVAFDPWLNESLSLKDRRIADEFDAIRKALLQRVSAYPRKPLPAQ